jgi:hypothetical protein
MSREQDPRIRDYILHHVEKFPTSISSRTAREFGFTRTGVSRYINRLVAEGLLVARGNTKARRYAMGEWRISNEEAPDRTLIILIRKTRTGMSPLFQTPVSARYLDAGTWMEVRENGTLGETILTPFEWKLP